MNQISQLTALGQSLWYDNIQRKLLENGEMAAMIQRGDIRGVTSNPTIFNNAIGKSKDYDSALKPMAWAGWNAEEIFFQLAVEDIRNAADLFRPLYDETQGADGYVSLEVSPALAHDARRTADEAKRLWKWVNRPNLMVKIPATVAGLSAIREAIADGVNVNVTLIFSLARYAEVIEAYFAGLEDRVKAGLPVGTIASVASFFVSRVDTKIDAQLEALVKQEGPQAQQAAGLFGKAAIANSRLAYALFKEKFASPRWQDLQQRGAKFQRPLWASTSTKNPSYRDVMYVEQLVGPHTVNTIPPQTLEAFRDHGEARLTIEDGLADARSALEQLASLGISMDQVTQELEQEGVKAFAESFEAMLKTIDSRKAAAVAELGPLQHAVIERIETLRQANFSKRMANIDPSLWTTQNDEAGWNEVEKRLGWLNAPLVSRKLQEELPAFLQGIQMDGFTHALLLGMGGSSLAPEVLAFTFGVREANGYAGLDLAILDSTDPVQVQAAAQRSPVEKTLYIVSSKSGTTSEINAFFHYFWDLAKKAVGDQSGRHFIAITDPGTALQKVAQERGFRQIFNADPTVGGRYSALTAFGVVPAALMGIDVDRFLDYGQWMMEQCLPAAPAARNPGLALGAVIGEAAVSGRDKLTLLADPELSSFGSWVEQLIAESSGKQGKGIIPVDIEPEMVPARYGADRLFVYMRQSGSQADFAARLRQAGHPVLELDVPSEYDLVAEFYRWEYATAVACSILEVNAFDQPDVQDSKNRTNQKVTAYQKNGKLDEAKPAWTGEDGLAFGELPFDATPLKTTGQLIAAFLNLIKPGDYLAINAYLPRNDEMFEKLQELRRGIQRITGGATTLGFGPRFQHSTGQLHKGGPDSGIFIQLTEDAGVDMEIPEEGLTFAVFERAQALGDFEALQARGRRAIRIQLKAGSFPKL